MLTDDTVNRIEEVFSKVANWAFIDVDGLEDDLISVLPDEIIDTTGGATEKHAPHKDKIAYCSVIEGVSSLMLNIKSSENPKQRKALADSFVYELRNNLFVYTHRRES